MMPPESVVIVLPLPPPILSPNRPGGTRGGRFARAAAAKRYKQLAESATVDAAAGMAWNKATVRALFFHKTERRRDDVNHLAMLKPAYDGIVLAGLIPDDDRTHLETVGADFAVDRKNPRVEIILTRVE